MMTRGGYLLRVKHLEEPRDDGENYHGHHDAQDS
jgi:hypothetical protein